MRLVGVDAETFYHRKEKYSLTSMGAEAYIRDPRFQLIGWSVHERELGDDRARPTPWMDWRRPKQAQKWLEGFELEREGTWVVAHNMAAFDCMVLSWVNGIIPWRMVDTLQMSRWLYGKSGPGGKGNSLAAIAEAFGLGEKGDEVIYADGKRLEDFTPVELAQYGRYCSNDTELCVRIFERLAPQFRPDDFTAMHLFACFNADPRIELDREILEEGLAEEKQRKAFLLSELSKQIGVEEAKLKSAVMSNPKFAQVLEVLGYEPPMKTSKTTGKPTFAFAKNDPWMQEAVESQDELLADVVRLRTGMKSTIMESRIETFLDVASRGAMPTAIRWQGAHTGRGAADGGVHKGQLQNLPARAAGKQNPLRRSMKARDGYWYAADSSQVEVRTSAELAGEHSLLTIFKRGQRARNKQLKALAAGDHVEADRWAKEVEAADVYLPLGKPLFGREITKADKDERDVTKAAILAAQFGQGWRGFMSHCRRHGIDISQDLAERTIEVYRSENVMLVQLWRQCRRAIRALAGEIGEFQFGIHHNITAREGSIVLPSGRELLYLDCRTDTEGEYGPEYEFTDKFTGARKKIWHGGLVENIVQATAYDILIWQANQIFKETGFTPTLFVHDELAYTDVPGRVDEWHDTLTYWMRKAPPWLPGVPLDCEFGHGESYADV